MSPLAALAVLAAGFVAGTVNTIVGSGSLVTFPVLLAVGYPSVLANVSNTVGLVPGSVSGALGYRRELAGQRRRCLVFGACSALGALTGGALLLSLPGKVFTSVVPVLILLACVLIAVQPRLKRPAGSGSPDRGRLAAGLLGVYLTGVYGGYFGAAQGVLLVGLLGLVVDDGLQRINALKNVLAAIVNTVAAVLFICVTHVAWGPAGLIAVGSVAGAFVGARVGRRIPDAVLRTTIVVVGTAVAVILFVR
ncbi:MAG: sulfite exporter TauE/SafE family protein [Actinomycetota bacterium]|nr:sulfite exporter TauE/SafE family protein [Actinomycetota bacterium]